MLQNYFSLTPPQYQKKVTSQHANKKLEEQINLVKEEVLSPLTPD